MTPNYEEVRARAEALVPEGPIEPRALKWEVIRLVNEAYLAGQLSAIHGMAELSRREQQYRYPEIVSVI